MQVLKVKYLADTDTVSACLRREPNVVAWMKQHQEEVGLTPFTLADMRRGIELNKDPKARLALERKFRQVLEDYRNAVYVFDEACAGEWGRMMADLAAELPPWDDSYIAAVANTYGLTVATGNTRHFRGAKTVNPFSEHPPGQAGA